MRDLDGRMPSGTEPLPSATPSGRGGKAASVSCAMLTAARAFVEAERLEIEADENARAACAAIAEPDLSIEQLRQRIDFNRQANDEAMTALKRRQGVEAVLLTAARELVRVSDETKASEIVRHRTRGTFYEVIGEAQAQVSRPTMMDGCTTITDGSLLVVYRGLADGKLWVRPPREFEDGRFEQVAAPCDEHPSGRKAD